MVMDALLIATGFTGALTFLWLFRLIVRPAPSISVSFAPAGACADVLVREIASARREVFLLAGQLACRPVAQALVDARLRSATVEIVLDPACDGDPSSDLSFLVEQGLTPLTAGKSGLHHQFVIIDGKTLLLASFPLVSEIDSSLAGSLLVVRGYPELLRSCQEEFALHRGSAQPVQAKTAPPSPPVVEPTPIEPQPEPAATSPTLTSSADLLARLRKQLDSQEEQIAGVQGEVSPPPHRAA